MKFDFDFKDVLGFLIITLLVVACGDGANVVATDGQPKSGQVWFEEVAVASGIDFVHQRNVETHYWLPEIMSGGVAWIDYDKDGFLDAYLVQGGDLSGKSGSNIGNVLLRNQGDGTFTDVTINAQVGDLGYGMGGTAGDFDGDGWVDLYVTNVGANVLYQNNGDGTFSDVTEYAGVGDPGWSTSAMFLDYDLDGDLDLFVANYVNWASDREMDCFGNSKERDYCHPRHFNAPAPDSLYRNEGDGRFTDVTRTSGVWRAYGHGLGVVHGDFNSDGLPDIYVANDGTPNQLWVNQGNGQFLNDALISGVAVNMSGKSEAGMGVAAVDIENDGDLDLFMTHLRDETNTLYLNNNGVFQDFTATAGFAAPSIPYTGFGVGFADFDHDGTTDVFVANGRVGQSLAPLAPGKPFAEPNQIFRGLGSGGFEEVSGVFDTIENSRAAGFADYDNDGDVDVLVVNNGGRAQLYKNLAGDGGNWIQFQVLGPDGQAAIGAKVRVGDTDSVQWRQVQRAYSYCASNDPRVHFGVGNSDQVGNVLVIWPDQIKEEFGPFSAGNVHTLRRGTGDVMAKK